MKAKIITFKPNKSGDVTLYLDKGADLRELIELIGQEVEIHKYEEKTEHSEFYSSKVLLTINDRLKAIFDYINFLLEETTAPITKQEKETVNLYDIKEEA